jgi:hypothetical protein
LNKLADRPQVRQTCRAPCRFASAVQGRQEEADQHGNDADDDEKFDEGERAVNATPIRSRGMTV